MPNFLVRRAVLSAALALLLTACQDMQRSPEANPSGTSLGIAPSSVSRPGTGAQFLRTETDGGFTTDVPTCEAPPALADLQTECSNLSFGSLTDAGFVTDVPTSPFEQAHSLCVKLTAADESFSRCNPNSACGQIGAFINEAEALLRSGQIDASALSPLIIQAQEIQQATCGGSREARASAPPLSPETTSRLAERALTDVVVPAMTANFVPGNAQLDHDRRALAGFSAGAALLTAALDERLAAANVHEALYLAAVTGNSVLAFRDEISAPKVRLSNLKLKVGGEAWMIEQAAFDAAGDGSIVATARVSDSKGATVEWRVARDRNRKITSDYGHQVDPAGAVKTAFRFVGNAAPGDTVTELLEYSQSANGAEIKQSYSFAGQNRPVLDDFCRQVSKAGGPAAGLCAPAANNCEQAWRVATGLKCGIRSSGPTAFEDFMRSCQKWTPVERGRIVSAFSCEDLSRSGILPSRQAAGTSRNVSRGASN